MTPVLVAHLAALDELVAAVSRGCAQQGDPIACAAGCSWCCRFAVDCGTLEAMAIAEALVAKGLDTPALRAQLERSGQLMRARRARRYWQLQRPCALLLAGRCSVYEVRPAMCRLHVSVRDPALCATNSGEGPTALQHVRDLHRRFCVGTSIGVPTRWMPDAVLRALRRTE